MRSRPAGRRAARAQKTVRAKLSPSGRGWVDQPLMLDLDSTSRLNRPFCVECCPSASLAQAQRGQGAPPVSSDKGTWPGFIASGGEGAGVRERVSLSGNGRWQDAIVTGTRANPPMARSRPAQLFPKTARMLEVLKKDRVPRSTTRSAIGTGGGSGGGSAARASALLKNHPNIFLPRVNPA